MIELRNKQYMTVLDGVAGAALEVGVAVKPAADAAGTGLSFTAATAAVDLQAAHGPLFAYWINPRSTAITFSGDEDGLGYTVAGSTNVDANHHIPSGSRMLAVGGKGVAQIRFYAESLGADLSPLPAVCTELAVNATDGKLCLTGHASAIDDAATNPIKVARVVAKDAVSITVLVG